MPKRKKSPIQDLVKELENVEEEINSSATASEKLRSANDCKASSSDACPPLGGLRSTSDPEEHSLSLHEVS